MYQVFPDRFARSAAADERPTPEWAIAAEWGDPVDPVMPARSQQFYGGDLDGVTEKLDHLVSLGVDLLYLTPVFPAASNHRYDAASFDRVDPLLGGDEAYIRLIEAAHARGIRVIGDLTSNHSGDTHEWFTAAYGHPGAAGAGVLLLHGCRQHPVRLMARVLEPAEVRLVVGGAARALRRRARTRWWRSG